MRDEALFGVCPDNEFFGRADEIDHICRSANTGRPPGIFLTGRRWAGKTEVLRRAHMRLFLDQASVVPVYYRFKECASSVDFAEDFLKEAIKQHLAFVKRDSRMLRAEISLDGLERLLLGCDSYDVVGLIESHREARKSGDNTAVLRNALKAPQRITMRSVIPVYLMLDDFHLIPAMPGGAVMMKEAAEVLNTGSCPFIISSLGGCAAGDLSCPIEVMELTGLAAEEAASMASALCVHHAVGFDPEILSIAVRKLEGTPFYIKNIVGAAARSKRDLTTLRDFADIYAAEIAGGSTGFAFRSALRLSGADLLILNESCRPHQASGDELSRKLGRGRDELEASIARLSASGLIDASLGAIRWTGDAVLRDFIDFTCETALKARGPEEVKTSLIRGLLKEVYGLKGGRLAVRLVEDASKALRSFNGQRAQRAFFRNGAEPLKDRAGEGRDEVALPQIVGCFDTSRWEKGEKGPVILAAQGFQNSRYGDGDEVVWVAGVKEARTPANAGDVDNFMRRSLILRENFKTPRIVRWIIAQEGFTDEARKRAEADGVYTTDSTQLRGLMDAIAEKPQGGTGVFPAKEFEVILPSAARAELVAAGAVEEIGSEMGFDEEARAGIKASVIEACINAFEHSRVKNSRVFLRFAAGLDRLAIYVENPGADFDSPVEGPKGVGLPRKRGWGIELMKGLMDEVRIEKVMGGARIVLVKRLSKRGERQG